MVSDKYIELLKKQGRTDKLKELGLYEEEKQEEKQPEINNNVFSELLNNRVCIRMSDNDILIIDRLKKYNETMSDFIRRLIKTENQRMTEG